MNDSRNHESSSLPLLYRPLCTRHSSYPKYIILINGGSPIPVRHGVLGHEISSALVNSGRAHEVPPVVDDIAETLCWLLEARSPIPLQCIFNMISSHLLRVCDIRTHHIHPFKAHFKLAAIAGCIIGRAHFNLDTFPDAVVYDTVTHYLGVRWGRRQIIIVHFKVVIMDLYQKMHELFIVSIPIVFYVSAVFF
jgi:hypothetical protein